MVYLRYSRKPSEEERTVVNKQIYTIMKKHGLAEYWFGMVLRIHDRLWYDGDANGQLMGVYSSYPEAEGQKYVVPSSLDCDDEDHITYEVFKIHVKRLVDDSRLVIDVFAHKDEIYNKELLFDVFSPDQLNALLPVPDVAVPDIEADNDIDVVDKFSVFFQQVDNLLLTYGSLAEPILRKVIGKINAKIKELET